MNILVTGKKGFIARNLPSAFDLHGANVVDTSEVDLHRINTGELCVHRNTEEQWADVFKTLDVDIVVHNAAVVGTDVVALNYDHATLTNVCGTYTIARAAEMAKIPVCYMGTSVIYDTAKYQDSPIHETSDCLPRTLYGALKFAGENIVKTQSSNWMIIRPLFAYGGVGDMNSLMAKTFFAIKDKRDSLDMFLDPSKAKDYLHVSDFCNAVALACVKGLFGDDYNVSAQTPCVTGEIVDVMSQVSGFDLSEIIRWHPETDYLGNHILSSEKFRRKSGWKPQLTLREGLESSWQDIMYKSSSNYNPLVYLDVARKIGIDLTQFY